MTDEPTYYSDVNAIKEDLYKYYNAGNGILTAAKIARGQDRGNMMVDKKLINLKIPDDPIPPEIVAAATLYAKAGIVDNIYIEIDNRSPIAIQWDKDADMILEGYIEENPEEVSGSILGCFVVDGKLLETEDEDYQE